MLLGVTCSNKGLIGRVKCWGETGPQDFRRPFFLAVFSHVTLYELSERGTTRSLFPVISIHGSDWPVLACMTAVNVTCDHLDGKRKQRFSSE